ncbi:MAG: hypothetical protein CSA64_02450 [Arachnia propionica]|nr:MAG: hypothetical protein CSA64_02450 [Arachnia propionica]
MTWLLFQPILAPMPEYLAAADAQLLDFEDSWFIADVPKEQAIMERFGISSTQYYQRLNALLDSEAALAYRPLLVKRLRRLRSQRQASRTARRFSSAG